MLGESRLVRNPGGRTITYAIEIDDVADTYMRVELLDKIVQKLAEKYVDEHGAEILSAIQAKTVDAKVIKKVIENLRKELKGESK